MCVCGKLTNGASQIHYTPNECLMEGTFNVSLFHPLVQGIFVRGMRHRLCVPSARLPALLLAGEMVTRIYGTLKIIAFNAKDVVKQHHEISTQLQEWNIDMSLFSNTQLKNQERFSIQNYCFYRADLFRATEDVTAFRIRKDLPHSHAERPASLLFSRTYSGRHNIC
jgi:hypothetical protein